MPYVIGLCGHGDIGMLDALYDRRDEITTISVHHEAAAGFIADAYYRVRRSPLATLTSCGPGSAQLLVALGAALMDSSALLAITGNVPATQFGRAPFQELGRHYQADFPGAARPYVKRSYQATRTDQLPVMLRQAFAVMSSGRPGPVNLDVPLNVFAEPAPAGAVTPPQPPPRSAASRPGRGRGAGPAARRGAAGDRGRAGRRGRCRGADGSRRRARRVLGGGRRSRGQLAGRQGPRIRRGGVPGPAGRNGTLQANRATRNADVILALGTRFDDRSASSWLDGYTYAIPPARLIHVHGDPAEIGRNYPAALGIGALVSAVLSQLRSALLARQSAGADPRARPDWGPRARWLAEVLRWREDWERQVARSRSADAIPMHPARVLAELRAVLPPDGILLSDVGSHHNWIVQEWQPGGPGTLLQSWGFAAMGFGVAGALGARLAAPGRAVAAVVGDGGFLMLPSVVATAVQYGLPVVWLVWNNGGFISIRDQQRGYFGREFATSFSYAASGEPYACDFAAMARSMGADGMRVQTPGDLGSALKTALASGRPTVIDVPVDAEIPQPAVATWELPPLPHPEPAFGWPDS